MPVNPVVLIQRAAARIFHRVSLAGPTVPQAGPVLLVANHQNSLLDPSLIQVVAKRPVRFLAKAPLFTDPLVGPLVRGAGSIPVYRKLDGEVPTGANESMFRAVHQRLAAGDAIGLFPEGISHGEPRLAPLRTGAARIALGAAAAGVRLPIVPIGIVLRDRGIFRSEVLLVSGLPVEWSDLADRGEEDTDAVRQLTDRIAAAISALIVEYEAWAEQPQIALMDRILQASIPAPHDTGRTDGRRAADARVSRWRQLASAWSTHRVDSPASHMLLDRAVRQHGRRLAVLRLTPTDLGVPVDWSTALRWALRRIPLAAFGVLTALGLLIAWIPYRLTGVLVAHRTDDGDDMTATVKAIGGAMLFFVWTILWTAVAAFAGGWLAATLTLIVIPLLSLVALWSMEGWMGAWRDTRRFILIRRRRERVAALVAEQARLAELLRNELAHVHVPGAGAAKTRVPASDNDQRA